MWFWKYPIEGINYTLSADVARGDSGDYSTFHVINNKNMTVDCEYKGKIPPDKFAMLLYDVGRRFNKAIICPEINSYGYTVALKLSEMGYSNLYFSSEKEKYKFMYGDEKNYGKIGFTTSKESRDKILANLEEALRNERIKVYSIRFLEEIKTFIWKNKKAIAMKGHNDDLVISLAIGCWLADNNSETYNTSQLQYADAMLQGMKVNKTDITQTNISPFYSSQDNYVNPFIPVHMSNSGSSNRITSNNPMYDLSWLYKK